ncbi:hypothetical protein DMB66_27400 [Actinoplanes sp. ATCC 53533]|uniref:SAM-dependent methyltransferase n=1 Tax=Actinoplanes sp. ATCC 53533 TaxID=1288362 RepID=UPI000F7A8F9C|nr:SAM-dependent methyltransferase [Actinoplanes sp. ATCC 53533]RSM59564.1 hypothetical protein DMB66_27400 [Actinoplanes sp. ATCC 53533]
MADDDPGLPPTVDPFVPHVARVWNVQLGGKDNFAVDRAAARALNEAYARVGAPGGDAVAVENRRFIGRAVRYLAGEAGIDQFLDIGSGLPSQGNVHEVAREVNPAARTVYVDNDPLVLTHGRVLLADDDTSIIVNRDMYDPGSILDDPDLRAMIDLDRPVAVLIVAMLHLIPDAARPEAIVAHIRDALAPGSYLALTHTTSEHRPEAAAALAQEFTRLGINTPMVPRSVEQISRFFAGFDLVEPGLISPAAWRPELTPAPAPAPVPDTRWMLAGVGCLSEVSRP